MTNQKPKRKDTRVGRYVARAKTTRPCVICGNPATGRADVQTCSPACRATKLRRDRAKASA